MTKPDKIIFLDIDGPMIPGTSYLENRFASLHQEFCPRCIMVLKKILEKSEAKVVFNSTHNLHLEKTTHIPGLLNVWKEHFDMDVLHPSIKTNYPNPTKTWLVPEGHKPTRRLIAIYEWLHDNYDMDKSNQVLWIAFDDEKIDHKRAFTVNFDAGLTIAEYNHAARYLHFKDMLIL